MSNISYILLNQQMSAKDKFTVKANNIANMNSTAFKGEKLLFREYLDKPTIGEEMTFSEEYATVRDTTEGELKTTGNPLDIAINGAGYFQIETQTGTRYSRNGNFQLNQENLLTDSAGNSVIGENGEIEIPSNSTSININNDGSIFVDGLNIAKLNIITFEDEQKLQKTAGGLYINNGSEEMANENVSVRQGMLEMSNINAILEMTQMMETLRQYEQTSKFINKIEEQQKSLLSKIGGKSN